MIKKPAFPELREQAIALRRAGRSRREIKELLGIGSNQTLNEALRGEPPQPWTWRPNAKDDLRAKARELRSQGLAYHQIADQLGVSKGSISLWVRDMPRPDRLSYEECCKRQAEAVARYWAAERLLREAGREAISAAAAAQISTLSDRETIIAGAVAYWCEGGKNKPYRRHDRVNFINSDPVMIKFFLRFLDVAGVPRDQLTFRIYVHESADVAAAQRFWLDATQAQLGQFRRPTLKRHNPRTVRKNTGDDYHGCLRIDILRGRSLYRKIEGWATAAMASVDSPEDPAKGQRAIKSADECEELTSERAVPRSEASA
jgi:transcriptional regulator with XRE-family HTH domain